MLDGAACGFFGKIPARGDFVRAGLPRSFVEPWDAWLQAVLAGSRALLGAGWLPAWLEAPIWRFALAPGIAGPDSVLGLWVPSVDRAGRHFPLTLACVAPGGTAAALQESGGAWLDAVERIGLAALEQDTPPETIAEQLRAAAPACALHAAPEQAATRWWTEGGPFVVSRRMALPGLPDAPGFAAMLSDAAEPRA